MSLSDPVIRAEPSDRLPQRQARPRQKLSWGFILFALLATLHLPIYEVGDKAVGWFDVLVLAATPLALGWFLTHRLPRVLPYEAVGGAFLVVFTGYAGATLALNWHRPMISLLPDEGFNFPVLLLAKQVEYLLTIVCAVYFARRASLASLQVALSLTLLTVAVYGLYAMFIAKIWYRLGLVNMSGEVSSNPAGFVLSICLLSLIGLRMQTREGGFGLRFLAGIASIFGYVALIFSYSRTNNIAFLLCMILMLITRLRGRVLFALCGLAPLVLTSNIIFTHFGQGKELGHYGISPLTFLTHPTLILSDPSLQLRIGEVWGAAYANWVSTPITVLFGIGFGKLRLADGLYPNLLFTTGVVGLWLYVAGFWMIARRGTVLIRCLVLFVALNGIATETTLNSFRSAQVFYVYIPALLFILHRTRKYEQWTSATKGSHRLRFEKHRLLEPTAER